MLWSQSDTLPRCLQLAFIPYWLGWFIGDIEDEGHPISQGDYVAVDGHPVQYAGHD